MLGQKMCLHHGALCSIPVNLICNTSDFIFSLFFPNPEKACIFPILEIFSQPEDFIGIFSQIQKAQAVSQKSNKITEHFF